MPGSRLSDIFTYLGDLFPAPAASDQNDFDLVLNEVSVLLSGLMEYYTLSQSVFKGMLLAVYFIFIHVFVDLAMFVTQSGRLSRDCQIQLNTILDLQARQSQLATQVSASSLIMPLSKIYLFISSRVMSPISLIILDEPCF